ncbi:MAG: hypothetical protein QOH93_1887 [Chloroflexia bacterium]|nr:hypothetical protein [Chloroflexia bacterium]
MNAGPPKLPFPVSSSVLDAAALAAEIERTYPIAEPRTCRLYRSYTNDVYNLQTADSSYIVKVYLAGWRTYGEVAYELDVLTHLRRRDVPVAAPLARHDGSLIGTVVAPEGARVVVLFEAATGAKPRPPFTPTLYYDFGQAAARLHSALDDFASPHPRVPLDFAYFLDRPLQMLAPYFVGRAADWDFLCNLAERARTRLGQLVAAGLDWGVCHGDLTLDNLHVTADNTLVLYDFDSGGPGWRAADPYGVFQFQTEEHNGVWDAFLAGYQEVRRFSATDIAAVPWFVALYIIYGLGFDASLSVKRRGQWVVSDAYFDRELARLRQWDATFLA